MNHCWIDNDALTPSEMQDAVEQYIHKHCVCYAQPSAIFNRTHNSEMTIKLKKLHPDAKVPEYTHGPNEDAGMDLHSIVAVNLRPFIPTLVKTGIAIELPAGYEAQIRPRSGLALKYGITIPNSPGTVDPGYRGEIGVILVWNGSFPSLNDPQGPVNNAGFANTYYAVNPGDRIAQMVVSRYQPVEFDLQEDLAESERGAGGFGSSGAN